MDKKSSFHSGHWQRVREKVMKTEVSKLTEVEMLELLLQYVFSRGDTNELAHRLLKQFGNFSNVLNASANDIMQVEGFGQTVAEKMVLIPKLLDFFRLCEAKRKPTEKILSTSDCVKVANSYLADLRKERLLMLCSGETGLLTKVVILADGDECSATVDVKDLILKAKENKAKYVVFAHNHPNGEPRPSMNDIQFTHRAYNILRLAGINVYDHIIILKGQFFSFAKYNFIAQFEAEYKKNFGK